MKRFANLPRKEILCTLRSVGNGEMLFCTLIDFWRTSRILLWCYPGSLNTKISIRIARIGQQKLVSFTIIWCLKTFILTLSATSISWLKDSAKERDSSATKAHSSLNMLFSFGNKNSWIPAQSRKNKPLSVVYVFSKFLILSLHARISFNLCWNHRKATRI